METKTKLIFKRRIQEDTNVYFPYLVMEKLRGYTTKKIFKLLSSTCKYYRQYYSTEMNKYWFELYSKKYCKKNVQKKHIDDITCECAEYLRTKSGNVVKTIKPPELQTQYEEMLKEYKTYKTQKLNKSIKQEPLKVYTLEVFIKLLPTLTSAELMMKLMKKYCICKKHVQHIYDYNNYDKNHNYFIRYLNGQQEELYLTRYNKFIITSNSEIRTAKSAINRLQRELEQTQKKLTNMNAKLAKAQENHGKILQKGWDTEFYPTVTSITEKLSE